ncbi:MAG: ABC transporter substrate-binding protein [Syntrophorhabdus aromaticivorans]|uniref:ABC transporter substrate-binding protein n=1 Tax=Syntrophorhabdus aromaticivorans TaxID=328301 RepID=A0A971M5C8_9BACT|nr:ABC transporter substrate-binding protein [Syntrophorhabdus aromaticivorans]
MKKQLVLCLVGWLLAVSSVVSAGEPLDTVQTQVNGVLNVLRDQSLKGETGLKVKREKVRIASQKLFDFVELSKRTLGINWNKLTVEQRKEFVRLYTDLLEDAYIDKITAYSDEKVTFTKEIRLSEKTVEVWSTVTTKTADVPINYRAIKTDASWKVYDVVIEGVSLISNYRTQFREILANKPPASLLEIMRTKASKR